MTTYRRYLAAQWRALRAEGLSRIDRATRTAQESLYRAEWTAELFRSVHDRRERLPADVLASARRVLTDAQYGHLIRYIASNPS